MSRKIKNEKKIKDLSLLIGENPSKLLNNGLLSLEDNKKINKILQKKKLIFKKKQKKTKSNHNGNDNTIKGKWSNKENNMLKDWIKKNGEKNWGKCCTLIEGRTSKQCREHWNNCLNPKLIKGNWTAEEDFLIMYFYEKCEGSWKKLITLFKGRTENSIKNRFFSQLRKIAAYLNKEEKKPKHSKYKLKELLKYLKIGIYISRKNYLSEKSISETALNKYLNELKDKINNIHINEDFENSDENETNGIIFNSNNLDNNIDNKKHILQKPVKKLIFISHKRKSSDKEDTPVILNPFQKKVDILNTKKENDKIINNNCNNNNINNEKCINIPYLSQNVESNEMKFENIVNNNKNNNENQQKNNLNNLFNNKNIFSEEKFKRMDSINIFQNNNIIINSLLEPSPINFTYNFYNPFFTFGNPFLKIANFFTDLQFLQTQNMYKSMQKPNNPSFNGNNNIENINFLNDKNLGAQNPIN